MAIFLLYNFQRYNLLLPIFVDFLKILLHLKGILSK